MHNIYNIFDIFYIYNIYNIKCQLLDFISVVEVNRGGWVDQDKNKGEAWQDQSLWRRKVTSGSNSS